MQGVANAAPFLLWRRTVMLCFALSVPCACPVRYRGTECYVGNSILRILVSYEGFVRSVPKFYIMWKFNVESGLKIRSTNKETCYMPNPNIGNKRDFTQRCMRNGYTKNTGKSSGLCGRYYDMISKICEENVEFLKGFYKRDTKGRV